MRVYFWVFAVMVACVSSTMAGIAVSSFDTQAQTNAYAPLDQSAYYATDDHPNASPATASVSDNWSGTNIGGSDVTWNMVTSAHISTMTTGTPTSLTISGAGSFNYNITTTAGFVDPTSVTTLYGPGAAGSFSYFFTSDVPSAYTLSAQLVKDSSINFSSSSGVVFRQTHTSGVTTTINMSGIIQPGEYQITGGAGAYGPTGLSPGVNSVIESGNINNFSFALQTPEPAMLGPVTLVTIILTRRFRASQLV